jgi:hypothetical protein
MEDVSPRLVDQRIRNRIIWQMADLARGDAYVRHWGPSNYFNDFFDWMPLDDETPIHSLAMTSVELAAVEHVRTLMQQACKATPKFLTIDSFILSGWPTQIAGPASEALKTLMERGELSDNIEESATLSPNQCWPTDP